MHEEFPGPESRRHFPENIPATMKSYIVLRDVALRLGDAETAKATEAGLVPIAQPEIDKSIYVSFDMDEEPELGVAIGPIDHIKLRDVGYNVGGGGAVSLGVKLYSDGSPYVFDEDIDIDTLQPNNYDLIIWPELSPFLVHSRKLANIDFKKLQGIDVASRDYLMAVVKGREAPVYYLNDSDCESLLGVITTLEAEIASRIEVDLDCYRPVQSSE